jgi:hypothetical protein
MGKIEKEKTESLRQTESLTAYNLRHCETQDGGQQQITASVGSFFLLEAGR